MMSFYEMISYFVGKILIFKVRKNRKKYSYLKTVFRYTWMGLQQTIIFIID